LSAYASVFVRAAIYHFVTFFHAYNKFIRRILLIYNDPLVIDQSVVLLTNCSWPLVSVSLTI